MVLPIIITIIFLLGACGGLCLVISGLASCGKQIKTIVLGACLALLIYVVKVPGVFLVIVFLGFSIISTLRTLKVIWVRCIMFDLLYQTRMFFYNNGNFFLFTSALILGLILGFEVGAKNPEVLNIHWELAILLGVCSLTLYFISKFKNFSLYGSIFSLETSTVALGMTLGCSSSQIKTEVNVNVSTVFTYVQEHPIVTTIFLVGGALLSFAWALNYVNNMYASFRIQKELLERRKFRESIASQHDVKVEPQMYLEESLTRKYGSCYPRTSKIEKIFGYHGENCRIILKVKDPEYFSPNFNVGDGLGRLHEYPAFIDFFNKKILRSGFLMRDRVRADVRDYCYRYLQDIKYNRSIPRGPRGNRHKYPEDIIQLKADAYTPEYIRKTVKYISRIYPEYTIEEVFIFTSNTIDLIQLQQFTVDLSGEIILV